jgi:hypothetical protein
MGPNAKAVTIGTIWDRVKKANKNLTDDELDQKP